MPPIHRGCSCQDKLVRRDHAESSTEAWRVAIKNKHGPLLLWLPPVRSSHSSLKALGNLPRLRESWCCCCRAELTEPAVRMPLPDPIHELVLSFWLCVASVCILQLHSPVKQAVPLPCPWAEMQLSLLPLLRSSLASLKEKGLLLTGCRSSIPDRMGSLPCTLLPAGATSSWYGCCWTVGPR